MKYQLSLIVIAAAILFSGSQTNAQVHFVPKAGINFGNIHFINIPEDVECCYNRYPSFMAGVNVEYDISEKIGIATGIEYHGKGAKDDDGYTYKISYLQIPLLAQFKGNHLYGGAGPFLAFPIGGSQGIKGDWEKLQFGNGELDSGDDFDAIDYGVNIEAGYSFDQLRCSVGYSFGLRNQFGEVFDSSEADWAIRTSVIGISLAYIIK